MLQLRHAFEKMHPAKYTFTSKADLDRWFNNRLAQINKPMDTRAFYPLIAPFFVMVGCGHTRLGLANDFWQGNEPKLMPLKLLALGSKVYVTGHYSDDHRVPIGSQILSTYTCNDNSQNLVLKNTGFKVRMPAQSYAVAVENRPDSSGILPDHLVEETITDMIHNRDAVFKFALKLIREKGK